jgi:hypothetical protein
MARNCGSLVLAALLCAAGCNNSSSGHKAAALAFFVQPMSAQAGAAIAPTVEVEVQDSGGTRVTSDVYSITLSIANNAGGGTLSGTLTVDTVDGVASFPGISIEKTGTGYTLSAADTSLTPATSAPFNITPGAPVRLVFSTQPPATTEAYGPFSVAVRILDALGNLVDTAPNTVTLSLANNPAHVILHNSGIDDPSNNSGNDRLFELIDPSVPMVLHRFASAPREDEVTAWAYDALNDIQYCAVRSENDFFSLDAETLAPTLIGMASVDEIRGMAFDATGSTLYAVHSSNTGGNVDDLLTVDPADGTETALGTITPDSGTIDGFNGLARDPTTDTFYAVVKLSGAGLSGRGLATIDVTTRDLTLVGDLGDLVAAISFAPDGTLYAVTGDGADVPETLYTVDKATGDMTELLPLGNGDDGENILVVPARLHGALSVPAVGGIATFPGLTLRAAATGYTIMASSTGITGATSSGIDVAAAPVGGIVQFTTAAQTVSEAVGTVTVTVQIDVAQTHDVIVTCSVGGSASGAEDLTPDTDINRLDYRNITIPAGQTSASTTFQVVNDTLVELDETVEFLIVSASLATIGPTDTHTVTIQSDD